MSHDHHTTADIAADFCSVPATNTTAEVGGARVPVVAYIFEVVDRYKVSEPIDFSIVKFEPRTFHDRIRAVGGVHLTRFNRVRIAALVSGQIELFDSTEVVLRGGEQPPSPRQKKPLEPSM